MIISASRRTDIPNYYSDWFYQRIKEGFVCVRNPMNAKQISRVPLSPDVVDCIVFWTKNPAPMMDRLDELAAYPYYFQFTLTGYGTDVERNVPHKKETMIPIFQALSDKIGKDRVIWRYDPILFTKTYTPEYHQNAFSQIAAALAGYTEKCVISFVDAYAKNKKALAALGAYELDEAACMAFAGALSETAAKNGMEAASCAERIDLSACGIRHNACIDRELIERITGSPIKAAKDQNQRSECGCIGSVDIGAYHTCQNGCRYCYANDSEAYVRKNVQRYDPASPVLCGTITADDRVTERKAASLKMPYVQGTIF
ncbi:MAG: DUF1848 domain-containing protein [bacterium]|nr:DUF1848 domain-containing protein [bacterium]